MFLLKLELQYLACFIGLQPVLLLMLLVLLPGIVLANAKKQLLIETLNKFLLYIIHSEVLRASPLLLAVTHLRLLAFSAQTMEIFNVVNFGGTCILC